MAASGYSPIQLYYSTTASTAPAAGNLVSGELAINITDGKLYYKDNAGVVQLLSTSTTANGTANGVLYLNGSKVATSGSALTFDGTTLATQTSAGGSLLLGSTTVGTSSTITATNNNGNAYANLNYVALSHTWKYGATTFASVDQNGTYIWYPGGSEQMRLTSTGLGIGTSSPGAKLGIAIPEYSASATAGMIRFQNPNVSADSCIQSYYVSSAGSELFIGANSYIDTAGSTNRFSASYASSYINVRRDGNLFFGTNTSSGSAVERMRLDSSGNLGIGASSLITKFTVQDTERFEVGGGSGFTYNQSLNAARSATVEHRSYGLFLTFGTGAGGSQAERMRLDSSGNLGLGVTPSAWGGSGVKAFDIGTAGGVAGSSSDVGVLANAYYNGSSWIYKTSSLAARYQILVGTGSHAWYTAPSGTAGNAITFTQAMTLDASGNLLFGVNGAKIGNSSIIGGDFQVVSDYDPTATLSLRGASYIRFSTYSGSWSERARIDSSGNLGIGETSPTSPLYVKSSGTVLTADAGTVALFQRNAETFNGAVVSIIGGTGGSSTLNFGDSASQSVGNINYDHSDNSMRFSTNGGERARIDSSGNLLVGATSPDARIFAYSSTGTSFKALNPSNVAQLLIGYNNTSYNYMDADNNIFRSGNGSERARIDSSGNLLVGKTASNTNVAGTELYGGSNAGILALAFAGRPLYINRLSTDGTLVEFAQGGTTQGSISISGSTTSYNTSSDYRLKDNQQPLTGSGAFIDALKPKTWNWKADGSRGVGFIAHEVQEVSPGSVVGKKDGEQMQAMEYGSAEFIANIIAELQSLRKRLADAGIA